MSGTEAAGVTVPGERGAAAGTARERAEVVPAAVARVLAPLGIVAGALALRFHGLGARSIWTDEGSTWTAAHGSLAFLVRRCAEREEAPPLYYLLTRLALRLGEGEFQLRLVSALASALLVWVVYRFARLYAGRVEASFAAALLAVSPFQVMYGQEARAYALVALGTTVAFYLFARVALLDRPRAWLPYVLASGLALWTQSIALLGTGVQAVLVAFAPPARRHAKAWLLAQVAIALLYLPWILVSWGVGSSPAAGHWYIHSPGGAEIFKLARAIFVSPLPLVSSLPGSSVPGLGRFLTSPGAWLAIALLVAVPLLLALRDLAAPPPRGRLLAAVLAALLLPPAAVLAATVWAPLWLPRFFVFLSVPFVLLLAHGVGRLRGPALAGAWGAALLVLYGFADVQYGAGYGKEDWREVTRHVVSASRPGHTAVLVLFDVDPFLFYDSKLAQPLPAWEVSHPDVPLGGSFTAAQLDEMEAGLRWRTARYDALWVVRRSLTSPSRRELSRRADEVAAYGRTLVEDRRWDSPGGPVFARKYERSPAPAGR